MQLMLTLEKDLLEEIIDLAKKQNKTPSEIAGELIGKAIEHREDKTLSLLADTLEDEETVSHEDAW